MQSIIGVKDKNNQSQAYILEFDSQKILFITHFPYHTIQYFLPPSLKFHLLSSHPVYQIHQEKIYLKTQIKFDLSYLNTLQLASVDYILLTDYKDLLTLPYITRLKQFHGKILLTHPMYQLGKILVESFMNKILQRDRHISQLYNPTFFQQSQAYDIFQEKYGYRVQDWVPIYNKENLSNMLNLCEKLNFGQEYKSRGIKLIPYSSGFSIGSCMWFLQSERMKQNIIFMSNNSNCEWRHALPIEKSRFQNKINRIILAGGCIKKNIEEVSFQLQKFLQSIQKQLAKSSNCYIKINDLLQILDLLDILNWKLKGIFKQLFIQDQIFDSFIKYSNSFVDYLSPPLKNKIYLQNPQYPFTSYTLMSQKLFLSCGQLDKIANNQRIPTKQLLLRYHPALFFITQYDSLLRQFNKFTHNKIMDVKMNNQQLKQWIKLIGIKQIYSFQEFGECTKIQYRLLYKIKQKRQSFIKIDDFQGFPIKRYRLDNKNLIKIKQGQKFSLVVKNWKSIIKKKLESENIICEIIEQQELLRTEHSVIKLQNYHFYIESNQIGQSQLIYKYLKSISRSLQIN